MNDMLPSNQNYFMSSKWTIFVWHKPWYDFQQRAFRQQMVRSYHKRKNWQWHLTVHLFKWKVAFNLCLPMELVSSHMRAI